MADVVVLGAGVSGHTAALHLSRLLPNGNTVTVVSPNSQWNWIPSNIWVGVGKMDKKQVVFPLAPVYKKKGIRFVQAKATAIWPRGDELSGQGAVDVEHTAAATAGKRERIRYDYLVNATGPQLKFGATPGLGPHGGHTVSVCTADHAVEAAAALRATIERLKAGESQTLVAAHLEQDRAGVAGAAVHRRLPQPDDDGDPRQGAPPEAAQRPQSDHHRLHAADDLGQEGRIPPARGLGVLPPDQALGQGTRGARRRVVAAQPWPRGASGQEANAVRPA